MVFNSISVRRLRVQNPLCADCDKSRVICFNAHTLLSGEMSTSRKFCKYILYDLFQYKFY